MIPNEKAETSDKAIYPYFDNLSYLIILKFLQIEKMKWKLILPWNEMTGKKSLVSIVMELCLQMISYLIA